ncbi:MAG: DUF4349 domain-containing protein [Myxococcota bacterium]|jgi:hypothetical protein|nr:DUF4349 domain-containing protein [Myxococcota bacterium]
MHSELRKALGVICFAAATAAMGRASAAEEPAVAQSRVAGVQASLVLKVVHPDEVRTTLVQKTKELGGYPSFLGDDSLTLLVPHAALPELSLLAAKSGTLLERRLSSEDITDAIAQGEAQVKSKTEMLERLHALLADAPVDGTLRVEERLSQLVIELEQVKGSLRLLRHRARYAMLNVAFRLPQRDRIAYVRSPFEWLNSVDLDRFLEEF